MPAMSAIESAFCRSPLWRPFATASARFASREPLTGRVLELGSGRGDVALKLTSDYPDITYVATDADPKMVALASSRLAGRPGVSVEQQDAIALTFESEFFDTVISCLMLHHVVQWEAAIAELARVLRPGGRVVGYDLVRTTINLAIHKVDGSEVRLLTPGELTECSQDHGLEPQVRNFGLGQSMSFTLTKPH